MIRTLRAFPTLLRVGIAETVAYRAEFLIWMLTTTMPLVMLGLWTSVASEAPFKQFTSDDFVAYYLAALIVRNLTSSWVVWQINEEIRNGTLSMRLLRPIHPFAGYAATHLSAVPLRALVALPFAAILLFTNARHIIATDPASLAMFLVSVAAAWVLTFSIMITLGAVAFWIQRTMGLADVYFGLFAVLSGYLVPLALMPSWIRAIAESSPFQYMLSVPVSILIGHARGTDALRLIGEQWIWALAMATLATLLWRRGVRRFEAYGA
jgi:ABC-2 type transport system permease protein